MNKKILTFVLVGVLTLAVVSAVAYYAMFSVSFSVNQPVEVSGDLEQVLAECDSGDSCLGQAITISNEGDDPRTVRIVKTLGSEDVSVSYVGKLNLTKKDTTTWNPLGEQVELTYSIVGETFEYSGVPEEYVLVYYKDGVVGLEGRLENPQPAIEVVSGIGSLPQVDDANLNADYSQAPDHYEHKIGAKLWVVPVDALNEDNTLDWSQMSEFYYETDLVYYFANANNELIVPSESFITFYPVFEPSTYVESGDYEFIFEIQ